MGKGEYFLRVSAEKSRPWKEKEPILSSLTMVLTERCNANCIHCCVNLPENDTEAQKKELSTGALKEIMAEAAALGCLRVQFTGGEPLLRPDFEELYLFARRLGLKVSLSTNGTLITPQITEILGRIPPREMIQISVYGMKRASYEAVTRTPGSFEAAWRGIHLLLKKKIPFVVKGVLLPPNRHEKQEFESWAATLSGMEFPPAYSLMLELRRNSRKEKNSQIKSLRLSANAMIHEFEKDPKVYLQEVKSFFAKRIFLQGDRLFPCATGTRGVKGCSDAYGYLQPCITLGDPATHYDLKQGSLKDGLTRLFPKIREMKATNPEYLSRCARCFLKAICDQCAAKSWQENGTLDTPVEYFCEVSHAQGKYLGLLRNGEAAWNVMDWWGRIAEFQKATSLG